jgi:glycosyltransferase involved in cell wall biosynthesis
VLVGQPDRGPADGLNNGLNRCSGEVVVYLNADDELAPGALSAISRLHQGTEAGVVIGNGWLINEDGSPRRHVISDRFSPFLYSCGVSTVLQQATSFKREVFDAGIRFNPDNRYNWDTELLFDAFTKGVGFQYTNESLGYFRMQPNSITVSGKYESGLRAERERLYRRGSKGLPRFIRQVLSVPLRVTKKVRAVLTRTPAFGGLVQDVTE